jgi:hypothetical protein
MWRSAETGGVSELQVLRRKIIEEKGWVRKELQRAIRAIEKREGRR